MGKRDRDARRGPPRQHDDREARKQADRMENDGMDQGGDFNIWYGPRKKRRGMEKAPSRCDPDLDAGVTRGSEAGALEFCIFFARGACARGYSCHKLHFIPTQEDDAAEDNMHDCFGRERSGADDDDRDGVGCFLKENRTLWVGGVPIIDEASARERVRRNFGAWGRISSVRLVKNKSCAFVQYTYRANAEFAKEAMSNQSLLSSEEASSRRATSEARGRGPGPRRPPSSSSTGGGGMLGRDGEAPVLHVRWAAEDPNPRAVIQARESHAQTLLAAQVATGALPRDVTGRLPGADRALLRKMGMDPTNPAQVDLEFQNTQRQYLAMQGQGSNDQYPNTDHQYPNTDSQYPSTSHQYQSIDNQYPNTDHQYQSTEHQYPSTERQYPSTDHQYPGTDHQYPSTDHQYPATHHQYPTTDHQYPGTNQGYPNNVRSASSAAHPEPRNSSSSAIRGHDKPVPGTTATTMNSTAEGIRSGVPGSRDAVVVGERTGDELDGEITKRPSTGLELQSVAVAAASGDRAVSGGGSLSLLGGYDSDDSG